MSNSNLIFVQDKILIDICNLFQVFLLLELYLRQQQDRYTWYAFTYISILMRISFEVKKKRT